MELMRLTLLMSLMMSSTITRTMEDNKSEDSLEAICKKIQEIVLPSQNPDTLRKIQEYETLKAFNDAKNARIKAWIDQCTAQGYNTRSKSKGKKEK